MASSAALADICGMTTGGKMQSDVRVSWLVTFDCSGQA